MIPLAEINVASDRFHVPAETIEKDYVLSWILLCLSKSKLRDHFVFYGGTAIKRIYFEEHRFSEDIDLLSIKTYTLDYLLESLDGFRYAREEANLVLDINRNNTIASKDRIQLYIAYSGYDEIVGAPKEIRIDFSKSMDLYGEIADRELIKSYSDLKTQHGTLSVMSLNTIIANKLGMLIDSTRNEPRDIFDIWFLLQRTDKFDFNFLQVCIVFNAKYGYKPTLNILLSHLQKKYVKERWEIRLRKQVAELPKIEMVINDIEDKLKQLFKDANFKN